MRQTTYFDIKEHVVPTCHIREYPGLTAGKQETILHLHVKQYTPRENPPKPDQHAVTIIAAHGSGFPKELYEPLWDDLYDQSASLGYSIRGIWIADMAAEGMSGVINELKISNDNSWMDHARDLLLMINHFREEMPRPIVGIGHSCGAVQLTNLAFLHPRLFTTVMLLDPVIVTLGPGQEPVSEIPIGIRVLVHRRDLWRNRAAAASFAKKAFGDWDKRILNLMLEYGFRDVPTALYPETPKDPTDPPVTLNTTKHQSALTHVRPYLDYQKGKEGALNRELYPDIDLSRTKMPMYRPETTFTMDRLPSLRPSALFILGDETNDFWHDSMRRAAKTAGTGLGGSGGIPEGRVREVLVNGGHSFPFTIVTETARICASWLNEEIDKYKEKERKWEIERREMKERDHLVLPAKWMEMVPSLRDTGSKL